ncbi:MAG: hypothetical protein LQ340_002256 [Diploschistes diacapsis]|nr:MAG: hypothetical protein LQ340_002256 [Diploschistes diacapsis]
MLQHSLPGSEESSRPPSPHRRITQALGGTSPLATRTLPGAEFVGSSPAPSAPHGISSAAFSPNYFKNFFIEERELGRGGKGVVLLVKHVLDGVSLGHFALKRIPVGDDHGWLEKVLVEVQLLQHLSHQNLVSYRHVWLEEIQITTFGPPVPCAFVLQQFCDAGDLQQYILKGAQTSVTKEELKQRMRRRSKNESEQPVRLAGPRKLHFEEIYAFFKDIASGLNHLHANNYIHRDLKPNNCLLHDTGKGLRALVSDFGEVQSENQVRQSTGATGTISYCAPEVLKRDPATGKLGNFTTKSDIFSLGMILYFLCFAKLPYRNADDLNEENEDVDLLRAEIVAWAGLEDQPNMRPDLPDRLYKFLRRLLSLDASHRPSAEDILHGIKTGAGLEELPDGRARHTGHSSQVYEDVQNSARISPVDTPVSTTPAPIRSRTLQRQGRQNTPSGLNFSTTRSEVSSDSDKDEEDRAVTPGGSLVLRSRHSSPVKLLPPSPAPVSLFDRMHVEYSQVLRTIKTATFLAKLVSIYLFCLPAAAQPATGLFLLALATVDLVLLDFGFLVSAILLALHFVLLAAALRIEALCFPTVNYWGVY